MRHGKGHGLGHSGMAHQHIVHFLRRNFFSTTVDDVLDTAGDEEVSLGIPIPLVTCPEPASREDALIGRGGVVVALHDRRATHDDLADAPGGQQGSCRVHNGDLWTYCHPDRPDLALTPRHRMTGHMPRSFGQTVDLNHRGMEYPF